MIKLIFLTLAFLVQDISKLPVININQKNVLYGESVFLHINNKGGVNGFYYIDLETWNGRHWIEADPDILNEDYDKIFFAKPLSNKKVLTIKYDTHLMDKVYLDNHKFYRFSLKYSEFGKVFRSIPSVTFCIRK